ncbi:hypothetical protein K8T06_04930 [bacterium]|nr:hypothetical protein [bacterium]
MSRHRHHVSLLKILSAFLFGAQLRYFVTIEELATKRPIGFMWGKPKDVKNWDQQENRTTAKLLIILILGLSDIYA